MLPRNVIGLIGLLRFKWTYLIAGGVLLAIAIGTYVTAHPAAAVEISGKIADYTEYTRNGSYDRNEMKISGSDTAYTIDKNSFHPTLPDSVYRDGLVDMWVDNGSTTVIAIQLYDQNDANPTKYTTEHYDNPGSQRSDAQSFGIVLGVIGIILVGIFGLWFFLGGRRPAMQMAGGGAVMGAPMPVSQAQSSAGLSADGKWYWDGTGWQHVSDDGRLRWDGTQWVELGTVYAAKGAPPPPATPTPAG